jgi:hypothetical protein
MRPFWLDAFYFTAASIVVLLYINFVGDVP